MNDALATARDHGLTAEVNGSGMQSMPETGGKSELLGVGVALLVLIITFGSLIAAGLPIITALVGVGLGMIGIYLATAFTTIGTSTPTLATMVGLAVGIDYTLFILMRYRTELHHTDDRQEAVGRAVGTAGSAVVFAGLTVLIALSALSVVGIPFLTGMGLAAAGTVLLAVLVALTLLPAILGLLKSKAFGGSVRKQHVKRDQDGLILNNGVRWARAIGRAPVAVVHAGRRRPGCPRPAAAGPAPRAAERLDGGCHHHPAQGVGPDQRGVRPGPRGSAAARRRRSGRARRRTVRRPSARSCAGRPTRRAWRTPRSSG